MCVIDTRKLVNLASPSTPMLTKYQLSSCYSHEDCADASLMCSGDGRCVEPIIQVENELTEDIEFELYAKQCASASPERYPVRSYDTYGTSPWEIVPDILKMYGMCSYHSWFEYLEFIDPIDKVRHRNAGVCTPQDMAAQKCDNPASFNAFESLWWDTQRPYSEPSMLTLYQTRKFQVLPQLPWIFDCFC